MPTDAPLGHFFSSLEDKTLKARKQIEQVLSKKPGTGRSLLWIMLIKFKHSLPLLMLVNL